MINNLSTEEVKNTKDLFLGLDKAIFSEPGSLEIDLDNPDQTTEVDSAIATKKAAETQAKTAEQEKLDKEAGLLEIDLDGDTTETTSTTTASTTSTTTESTTPAPGDDQTETDSLKLFTQALQKEGVINQEIKLDEFDGTVEGLKAIFEEEKFHGAKQMVEEYKNSLPPIIKYLADNYEDGVPLEELINIKSAEIKYSSIDTEKLKEDTNLQKTVYSEYLKKTTNFSQAKIDKEIARLEDLEELGKEVEEVLPELVNFEKQREIKLKEETKKQQEETQKRNQETLASIKKTAESFKDKEIVPGIKLTTKDVESLYKSLTTPVGRDENGAPISEIQKLRAEDPIGFEIRLNHIAKLTKGFTDFSTIMKKATTVATQKVAETVNKTPVYKAGKDGIVDDEDTTASMLKGVSGFLKKYNK